MVFDTRYPDGKDGQVYGGIDYRGSIDSAGSYVYTWGVSLAAPVGDETAIGDLVGHRVGEAVQFVGEQARLAQELRRL